ncbi:MAG: hypothetical protein L0H59_02260 [Tomitella sp.]|nr:hypothetical protein [Tomitella sp.]
MSESDRGENPAHDGDASAPPSRPAADSPADTHEHTVGKSSGRRASLLIGGSLAGVGIIVAAVFGGLYETGTAPFGDSAGSDTAAIDKATRTYVDAMNSQKVNRMRDAVCPEDQAQFANVADGEPVPNPVHIDSVSDVIVNDDTATATLSASVDAQDQVQTQDFALGFKLDGGTWKVCQSVSDAQAPN